MASQQQQLTDIQIRLDRIEQAAKIPHKDHATRNVVLAVLLTAVVTGIGWWSWFVTTNIVAMKQQMADGGNKQIVAELKSPKSPQQLQANLSTVIAQVERARLDGKAANPQKVTALSKAVAEVVKSDPEIGDGWRAAGLLVSYRSQDGRLQEQPCIDDGHKASYMSTRFVGGQPVEDIVSNWHDCTMQLDDNKYLQIALVEGGMALTGQLTLRLDRVRVVYRGGTIPNFDQIDFVNCNFDFSLPSSPPPLGRSITQQLLASTSLDSVHVSHG